MNTTDPRSADPADPSDRPVGAADELNAFESADPRSTLSEDGWAIVLGLGALVVALTLVAIGIPFDGRFGLPGGWKTSPLTSLIGDGSLPWPPRGAPWPPWAASLASVLVLGLFGIPAMVATRRAAKSGDIWRILLGFLAVSLLAATAYVMSRQEVVKHYGFDNVLWALLLGLLISNTIGTPHWMRGAVRGELFIKWGLVLLGAEILLGKLVTLGIPGIMVSWVVTPIVLVTTFAFGCRILKIRSPSLVMVVAADMSVCGVSAAIATAAACRAKKEELSLAIGMSLAFTAVMMVVMPRVFLLLGVDDIVGGAWIGGTIDSTGAVAAAGASMGDRAMKIATTVKMIQNVLIGVIAFAVSIYWATRYETGPAAATSERHTSAFFSEVWRRFPKFVLGFLAASLIASGLAWSGDSGTELIDASVGSVTKHLRNWLFCLAFVCIGLETHVRSLLPALGGGKTLVLYAVGQSFNIALTGLMATLVFGWLFRDAITGWLP